MCYYTASYLKLQFCRPGGVFWPFLDPREAKKGKKKLNRQTPDKKITFKKNVRMLATFQKKNHCCTIITHRATFVYFCRFFLSPYGTLQTIFYFIYQSNYFITSLYKLARARASAHYIGGSLVNFLIQLDLFPYKTLHVLAQVFVVEAALEST